MTTTPQQIREARHRAELTQTEAGRVVHRSLRSWQKWEWGEEDMPPELWELFNLKVKGNNK